ncbi:uncharacterized protein LOC133331773 [Musca vetustissima]|uniref:uncharacterized protein LOC133331773 n=1 Tax=Musca vetustissima TaxID=27455 RepID=UPI002AB684C7|nr:uncharacterized protein LOC133331773 [Musca vetustissima]
MSDIYDYVYAHSMACSNSHHHCRKEHETYINTNETASTINFEDDTLQSETEINTSQFSPNDLQTFVDSLETIARLERSKHNRKLRRKQKRSQRKRQVTCLDSSTCSSIHEEDLLSSSDEEFSSHDDDDEGADLYDDKYFAALHGQKQSTALYSNSAVDSSINSDSEDSGVFVINRSISTSNESHLYENIPPLQPKSKMVSYSKSKSLKMRLMSLIKRRHDAKAALPSRDILSSTAIGELSVASDVPQKANKKTKKSKTKPSSSKSENKLLEKAMRLLTL